MAAASPDVEEIEWQAELAAFFMEHHFLLERMT